MAGKSITHRNAIEAIQPNASTMSAVQAAVNMLEGSQIQKMLEHTRIMGFVHKAFGTFEPRVSNEDLKRALYRTLNERNDYFARKKGRYQPQPVRRAEMRGTMSNHSGIG